MSKGFGVAALALASAAIFIPLYGFWASGLAMIFACVAASGGDQLFAASASLIALVNTFLLTPSLDLLFGIGGKLVLFIAVLAPFAAILLHRYRSQIVAFYAEPGSREKQS